MDRCDVEPGNGLHKGWSLRRATHHSAGHDLDGDRHHRALPLGIDRDAGKSWSSVEAMLPGARQPLGNGVDSVVELFYTIAVWFAISDSDRVEF
jgi:hypothetical protein